MIFMIAARINNLLLSGKQQVIQVGFYGLLKAVKFQASVTKDAVHIGGEDLLLVIFHFLGLHVFETHQHLLTAVTARVKFASVKIWKKITEFVVGGCLLTAIPGRFNYTI